MTADTKIMPAVRLGLLCQEPRPDVFSACHLADHQERPSKEAIEAASQSKAAYDGKGNIQAKDLPHDLQNMDMLDPKTGWFKTRSGLRAGLYMRSDGGVNLVAVGTEDLFDVIADIKQALGLRSAQYDDAAVLARAVSKAYGSELRLMVGHSLGGATVMAGVARTRFVSINSAGLHPNTIRRYGLDSGALSGSGKAYFLKGEILSAVQDLTPLPDAVGERIALGPFQLADPTYT